MAYGRIVRERSVLRQLIGAANQLPILRSRLMAAIAIPCWILPSRLYKLPSSVTDGGPKVGPLLAKAIEKVNS